MNASKENARRANKELEGTALWVDQLGCPDDPLKGEIKRALLRIQVFLEAAERKLPTEATYRRAEKPRKRTKLANG